MDHGTPNRFGRELAERSSNGTQVRLLWGQGTGRLWVEIRERENDWSLAIPVPPARALDAFHHPYAYAAAHSLLLSAEPLAACEHGPRAIGKEDCEQ